MGRSAPDVHLTLPSKKVFAMLLNFLCIYIACCFFILFSSPCYSLYNSGDLGEKVGKRGGLVVHRVELVPLRPSPDSRHPGSIPAHGPLLSSPLSLPHKKDKNFEEKKCVNNQFYDW